MNNTKVANQHNYESGYIIKILVNGRKVNIKVTI